MTVFWRQFLSVTFTWDLLTKAHLLPKIPRILCRSVLAGNRKMEVFDVFDRSSFRTLIPREGFKWVFMAPFKVNLRGKGLYFKEYLVDPWVLSPKKSDFSANRKNQAVPAKDDMFDGIKEDRWRELWKEVFPFRDVVPVFSRLASLTPDENSVCGFANQYGTLGRDEVALLTVDRSSFQDSQLPKKRQATPWIPKPLWWQTIHRQLGKVAACGDSLKDWAFDIGFMKDCVRSFRGILSSDDQAMASMFDISNDDSGVTASFKGFVALKLHFEAELAGQQSRLPMAMAGRVICILVNEMLMKGNSHSDLDSRHTSLLEFDSRNKSFSFIGSPFSFREAIWYEFLDALQNMNSFRQCQACDHLIRIGEGASRKSRYYCSTKCRSKVKRDRQKEARQLRADGMHLHELAKRFDTKLETVKSWCKDVKLP